MTMKSPCMKCRLRCAGCHGECAKYKDYSETLRAVDIEIRKYREITYLGIKGMCKDFSTKSFW